MPARATVLASAGVLMTLVGQTSNVDAQNDTAQRQPRSEISTGVPAYSSGEYKGHKWHIDEVGPPETDGQERDYRKP